MILIKQAASLLGADIFVSGNKPAGDNVLQIMDSVAADQSRKIELLTMSYLPKTEESQFVRLGAVTGSYPYYGKIVTEPAGAYEKLNQNQSVVVDESMMIQYGLDVGDSLRLGPVYFEISGTLKKIYWISRCRSRIRTSRFYGITAY